MAEINFSSISALFENVAPINGAAINHWFNNHDKF